MCVCESLCACVSVLDQNQGCFVKTCEVPKGGVDRSGRASFRQPRQRPQAHGDQASAGLHSGKHRRASSLLRFPARL